MISYPTYFFNIDRPHFSLLDIFTLFFRVFCIVPVPLSFNLVLNHLHSEQQRVAL